VLTGVPPALKTPRHEVGNPVRDAVLEIAGLPFQEPKIGEPFRFLITGGSQGASLFSQVPVDAISALPNHLRRSLIVSHQVRQEDIASVKEQYGRLGVTAEIEPFFQDLPQKINQTHLVLARSGASTVTEIATLARPAIFVPLAIAMDDHQTMNARVLSEADAAILIPEKDFNAGGLRATLERLMTSPGHLSRMVEAANGRVKTNAAVMMADLVEEMIELNG